MVDRLLARPDLNDRLLIKSEEKTRVSDPARHLMTHWGISGYQIDFLQKLLHCFKGKYAHCPEKVEHIKTVIREDDLSQFETQLVNVPLFFDAMGRGTGGQCGDLSDVLLYQLGVSGFIDKLQALQPSHYIDIGKIHGHSRTHFATTNHVWIGIQHQDDMVVLDPAYQQFATLKETGFSPKRYSWVNAKVRRQMEKRQLDATFIQYDLPPYATGKSRLGKISTTPKGEILGISEDGEYAYGLGFGHMGRVVTPFIDVWHANSVDRGIFLYEPNKTDITALLTNPSTMILNQSHRSEIRRMLDATLQFNYVRSSDMCRDQKALMNQDMHMSW